MLGLVIDASAPSTVYAGSTDGLFQTTNGGTSWAALTSGLPANAGFHGVSSQIAIDPTNPATVYATTVGELFRPATWSRSPAST